MEGPKDANLSNDVFEDFSSGEDDHPEEEITETVEDKDIEVKSSRNCTALYSHYHHSCCYRYYIISYVSIHVL